MTHDNDDADNPTPVTVAYLDLLAMIGPRYVVDVLWPLDSPFGKLACENNLHELHDGDCSENQS